MALGLAHGFDVKCMSWTSRKAKGKARNAGMGGVGTSFVLARKLKEELCGCGAFVS